MNNCNDFRGRLILYLDDELQGSERRVLEAHLEQCASCRATFENEHQFVQAIRQSAPHHQASTQLRARVEQLLGDAQIPASAPARLRRRIQRVLSTTPAGYRRHLLWQAAVIVAIAIMAWGFYYFRSPAPASVTGPSVSGPSEFALMAAGTHLRRARGQLPLEIASAAPAQISNWFADKVSFSVKLPNYQEASGQEKLYRLEGARLVGYKNDYVAYVAYQMKTRPISLVITSERMAQPMGGEQIAAKGLTFHYNSIEGLKVITWSDRGLTYALVSDLEERGQQSCIVCHEGTKDQDFIAPLKPL